MNNNINPQTPRSFINTIDRNNYGSANLHGETKCKYTLVNNFIKMQHVIERLNINSFSMIEIFSLLVTFLRN